MIILKGAPPWWEVLGFQDRPAGEGVIERVSAMCRFRQDAARERLRKDPQRSGEEQERFQAAFEEGVLDLVGASRT